jgi:hypothetical protein
MPFDDRLETAHHHSSGHRDELMRSTLCGCFYCGETFEVSQIQQWIDDGHTALCPHCEVDAVIGSASGFPVTDSFLQEMHNYWF